MSERRKIADAARVVEYPDGSRELQWSDGVMRRYSKPTIAGMFLEALETGRTNPLLERLTTEKEREEMYEAAEQLSAMDFTQLAAVGDLSLPGGATSA